jgi:hypothetical protein
VTLALKIPLHIAGRFFPVGHGRPCIVAGERVRVRLEPDDSQREPDAAFRDLPVAQLSPAERDALASYWTRAAEEERESVAALRRLCLALSASGAPAELLARSASAAADEVRRAKLARSIAEQLGTRSLAERLRRDRSARRAGTRLRGLDRDRAAAEPLSGGRHALARVCANEGDRTLDDRDVGT